MIYKVTAPNIHRMRATNLTLTGLRRIVQTIVATVVRMNCTDYLWYSQKPSATLLMNTYGVNGPQRKNLYIWTYVPSEDSDKPVHSRNLIRIFTYRNLNSKECIFFMRTAKIVIRLRGIAG